MGGSALAGVVKVRLAIPLAFLSLTACAGSPPRPLESRPDPVRATAPAHCGGPGPIEILAADVAIVIDTSTSTREPLGVDLDRDGRVGEYRRSEYTDPDDSLFAVQLAAIERLVRVATLDGMRFSIVSLAGRKDYPLTDSLTQRVDPRDARLESELTDDVAVLETALARVSERGPDGTSSFVPAMKLALRSLQPDSSAAPKARRRVLFLSDSPTLVRYAPAERTARNDPRLKIEARRALKAGVRFDTFGLGPAAQAEPPHALAQIAGATGGTYRAVGDPTGLYCELLATLRVGEPRSVVPTSDRHGGKQ